MTLNLSVPVQEEILSPRITVIGVGGAGGNAVNNMIRSNLEGVEFVVSNTDAQAMKQSLCEHRIQLGRNITAGLGAGSRPEVGRAAAEEALEEILAHLDGSNMVFITAGMGGGTGTGAAPVIARAAREAGILTVGVVTKPFQFEGVHRMRLAENGIQELTQYVDTLIIIPNQNLFRVANEKTTFADAFKMADDVLYSGVRGVTDLMVMPGLINLDFADIRAVMTEMGKAMMGTGEAEGNDRAIAAAEAAISNPLLDDVSMRGARGVLINITGGMDMTLFEVDEAANRIRDEVDPEANIIFGSTFDESLDGRMRVSVVATGIDMEAATQPKPVNLSVVGGVGAAASGAAPATPSGPAGAGAVQAKGPYKPQAQPAARQPVQAHAPSAGRVGTSAASPQAAARPVAQPMGATVTAEAVRQEEPPAEPVAYHAPIEAGDDPYEPDVTPPQAEVAEDSFIAPEPARPASRQMPVNHSREDAEASPARERRERRREQAQTEPATGSGMRNKAYSLFAKVARASRSAAAPEARTDEPAATRREEAASARNEPRNEPRMEPTLGNPAAARPAERRSAEPAEQPSLGLDPDDRLASRKEDEEMLDIPAFLRRQAN